MLQPSSSEMFKSTQGIERCLEDWCC